MEKVTVNGTVVLHQHYLYRGYLQIAALDLTRSNAPALWLLHWNPAQPIATRPLSIRKNGTWYTYGHDLTKNVTELYKADGTIATVYDYTPYGTVTASGIDQPIQWSSEHYDPELALVYYNYRHYNPTDGRWINRDPIAEEGGRNLYAFVGNSIYNFLDVLGTDRIYKCEGSNCLGSALSGRGDVAYRTDDKKPKSSFMNEMKLKGWNCYKIEKTYKDCLCKCEEAKVVISAYKIEDVNKGKYPWTDPSFHWEPQRKLKPGEDWPTDYHAIRSDYGDQDNYMHILNYRPKKRKFSKVPQNDLDSLFVNKPMLCCCKKRSNTISPNDIEKE